HPAPLPPPPPTPARPPPPPQPAHRPAARRPRPPGRPGRPGGPHLAAPGARRGGGAGVTGTGTTGPDSGVARPVRVDALADLLPAARSLWGYVWAAPNSLVGLLGGLTTRSRPVRWRGALLVEDADGGLVRVPPWRALAGINLPQL